MTDNLEEMNVSNEYPSDGEAEQKETASENEEVQGEDGKKRKKPRKLFWLLLRNTVIFWVPSILLLGGMLVFLWKYPIVYHNTCHTVHRLDEMQDWYDEQCYNVRYYAAGLKYTGYDYYENGNLTGAYYYIFEGDQCLFVLVKTKAPEPVIESARLRGKLLKDSAHTEAVMDQFAAEVGMERDSFMEIVYPLVLSEVDYSWTQTILIWLLIILPGIWMAIIVFLGIEWIVRPYTHPNIKRLEEFGERKAVYYEVNAQLNMENVIHQDHYYFTDDYLILDRFGYMIFVRIDRIRFISKHATKNKRQQRYRLIMSDEERTYFEQDFKSEECVDSIMKEMIARNAQIDDQTLRVFNLPTEEAESVDGKPADIESSGIESANMESAGGEPDKPDQEMTDESSVGIDDAENLKIYNVRRRLRKREADADNVKIYRVRRRLRKKNENGETDK